MRHALLLLAALTTAGAQPFDLVINNGRVLNPASNLDAIRHIGIRAGKIAAISTTPLLGKRVINAANLAVAPGFIDLHAHGQDEENQRFQLRDGVTTALELEVGAGDINAWYSAREGKRLIHSGVSVGHVPSRMLAKHEPPSKVGFVPQGPAAFDKPTEEEITLMKRNIEKGLQQGALGVGFGIQYTPASSRWEILEMFRVAGRFRAPAFVHIRHMGDAEPDALNALEEVISAAAITGAPLHVVHITSSGLTQTPKLLQTIADARARSLDVTTECYPYSAAMTELSSAMFAPGWQKVLGISFDKLEWTATGERLTPETFAKYRQQQGLVIMHMIPDAVVRLAVSHPSTIIASDGYLHDGKGHPRGAGTYARTLGYWVREQQALPLLDAIRKMSLLPAQRLESFVPAMKAKGRISLNADADLVIFDPATIKDNATFQNPAQYSTGIPYVIVAGTPIVSENQIQPNLFPGRAVRAPLR